MRKEIAIGQTLPPGYGMAYYRYDAQKAVCYAVCYPVPINKLVGLWRRFWIWAIQPISQPTIPLREAQIAENQLREETREAICAINNRLQEAIAMREYWKRQCFEMMRQKPNKKAAGD